MTTHLPVSQVTSRTDTGAVHGITLGPGIPVTVTCLFTLVPVERRGTWDITVRQVPAGFTLALSGKWVTTTEQ